MSTMVWPKVCLGKDSTAVDDMYAGGRTSACGRTGDTRWERLADVWLRGVPTRTLFVDWYREATLTLADPPCPLVRDMQQQ